MIRTFEFPDESLSRSFYKETLKKALSEFTPIPGVRSIYQFGEIGVVGNSDIDLMFVIEHSPETARSLFETFNKRFTDAEKFIIYQHDPLVTSASIAPDIHFVRGCSNLVHLHGEKYDFNDELGPYVRFYLLVDLLTQYYPRIFQTPGRDLRLRFQHVNAFRFPYGMLEGLEREFHISCLSKTARTQVGQALRENNTLRAEYHDMPPEDVLFRLEGFEKTISIASRDIIHGVDGFLDDSVGNGLEPQNTRILDRLFQDSEKGTFKVLKLGHKRIGFWCYPLTFAPFFTGTAPSAFGQGVTRRNQVLSRYCDFIDTVVGGRNLYYPWWRKTEKPRTRLIRTLATRLGRLNHE